ncbi:hypothetical protein TNCV_2794621 [Trichonephila clavipes]|nr:hypothetical protein TNCV_2794621 [Trichonephila clavipes]
MSNEFLNLLYALLVSREGDDAPIAVEAPVPVGSCLKKSLGMLLGKDMLDYGEAESFNPPSLCTPLTILTENRY